MAGDDTRNRILDCAEELFAQHGVAATSLRSITTAAEVNLAAIHYHFGSKELLLRSLIERRLLPLNKERIEALGSLAPEELSVERIVRTFVEPAFKLCHDQAGGIGFVKTLARLHGEADPATQKMIISFFEELMSTYLSALQVVLPELSIVELQMRFFLMVGSMAYALIHWNNVEYFCVMKGQSVRGSGIMEQLISFVTAGLLAGQRVQEVI